MGARLAQLRVEGQRVCASRLGGDEFVVLFSSARGRETSELAADVAHAVEGEVGAPVRIGSACIRPHASVGITCERASRARLSDMLAEADAAMYRVKRHTGVVYAHIRQIDGRLDVARCPGGPPRDRRLQTAMQC